MRMTKEEREQAKQVRRERERERDEQERKDKGLILTAMRSILSDTAATAGQKLYAFSVLCHMQYYNFAPYGIPFPDKAEKIDLSRLREKFADELEAFRAKETTNTPK